MADQCDVRVDSIGIELKLRRGTESGDVVHKACQIPNVLNNFLQINVKFLAWPDTAMKISDLVCSLVNASEKAALIARTVRSEQALFKLLVEEKEGVQKNRRFFKDFKTLGDVLIQEVVCHDVGRQFSGLAEHILGEESNQFTNVLGETIEVAVQPSQEETSALLATVLDGQVDAASLLAKVVHEHVQVAPHRKLKTLEAEIPVERVGVWIDPIDSTYQYISGKEGTTDTHNIINKGLPCVTVLIGAFDRQTGKPIAGVVNQPFVTLDEENNSWTGEHIWGVSYDGQNLVSSEPEPNIPKVIITSTCEESRIRETLSKKYEISYSAGAGFKSLCVVKHQGCAYILSPPTTFKWDTCAPQAILNALGGGIVNYQDSQKLVKESVNLSDDDLVEELSKLQIRYDRADVSAAGTGQPWCNTGGLLAYTQSKDMLAILRLLL